MRRRQFSFRANERKHTEDYPMISVGPAVEHSRETLADRAFSSLGQGVGRKVRRLKPQTCRITRNCTMWVSLLAITFSSGLVSAQTKTVNIAPQVARQDFDVDSDPGIRIFVREIHAVCGIAKDNGVPILLVHGARPAGVGWFDLDVPGGSLAADIAAAGHIVFVMDVRGYGASTRPPEMSQEPTANPPLVRSSEAVHDIRAVVDWIRQKLGVNRVALLGWATGGHWSGYYASLYSERVSHLILVNTLYGASSAWPLRTDFEDPKAPGRFNFSALGAYYFATAQSLLARWDRSIPATDRSSWRDPAVVSAYVSAALDSDPTSRSRNPASLRIPVGPLEDSFYLSMGRQFWDASLIRVPTLILRSELDFWSRSDDVKRLSEHLVHAPEVRMVELPQATHYVLLDRPEHGRTTLLQEVVSFLAQSTR